MRTIALTLFMAVISSVACKSTTSDQWQPIQNIPNGFRRHLVGDPRNAGPFKYQIKVPANSRAGAHHHSKDVHVKVLSGAIFIIIGEPLDSSRAQRFATGSNFIVPANTLHSEWWDEESVLEAEGVGPMETVYKDGAEQNSSPTLFTTVDHLVYATPDLNRGVEEIEKLLGVRATVGGQHPGRGTRNALIALGPRTYLEIIAPDPDQPPPKNPRPFGIDGLKKSRLVAWFVSSPDLEQWRARAVGNGVPLGEVMSGSRRRPDGTQLSWQFTDPSAVVANGIVPLLINWGESDHPANSAAKGATLISLRAEHPDVQRVSAMLRHLAIDLPLKAGESPALIAIIEGPRGRVELR